MNPGFRSIAFHPFTRNGRCRTGKKLRAQIFKLQKTVKLSWLTVWVDCPSIKWICWCNYWCRLIRMDKTPTDCLGKYIAEFGSSKNVLKECPRMIWLFSKFRNSFQSFPTFSALKKYKSHAVYSMLQKLWVKKRVSLARNDFGISSPPHNPEQ